MQSVADRIYRPNCGRSAQQGLDARDFVDIGARSAIDVAFTGCMATTGSDG